MTTCRRPLLLLSLIALLAAWPARAQEARAQDGAEPITASDLFEIRQLGDVAVSPDGRSVVYTVRRAVREVEAGDTTYGYRTHLYLASATGREAPRPLTRGEASATQPAWHPDGDRLAFVRTVEGEPQVFVLPLLGGEAYPLTDAEHGATRPRWSPDGRRLLYASTLPLRTVQEQMQSAQMQHVPAWPTERPGRTPADTAGAAPDPDGSLAQVRTWLARNRADGDPVVTTRLDFQGEHVLDGDPSFRHLYVISVTDSAGAEPPAPTALTQGFYRFGGGTWTADGEHVVMSGARADDEHPDRVRQTRLYVAEADGQSFRELLAMDGYALSTPVAAPEGTTVAFLARRLDDPGYAQTELGLFLMDGESPDEAPPARLLTEAFDRSVGAPQWSPDGWHLYTVAPSDGGFPLYRLTPFATDSLRTDSLRTDSLRTDSLRTDSLAADTLAADTLAADTLAAAGPAATDSVPPDTAAVVTASGPPVERLTSYGRGVRSFDVSRATLFYVVTEPANPYELYARGVRPTASERRLTSHNATWLEDRRLSRPEAFTVRRDSVEIQAWTMKPAFFEEGHRYPLLVQMHGGPSAMWGPGEATMWHEFQLFAARGYGIVFSNPRGSGGYGRDFKAANYRDWGTTPAGDVLAAAHVAAAEPWIDPSRQVLTGGSYAGYLTAWIVAHDDRFEAAVAQRGVYDLATFFGEGNAWRLVPYHFGGYPWEDGTSAPADSVAAGPAGADSAMVAEAPAADTARSSQHVRTPREALIRNSPLTYVDQITTPLLIIHASQDLRTGVSQSEMLYRALKVLERPVEYVRYPDAGHDLSRTGNPKQRMDRLLRIYEFFERFINRPPQDTATATEAER